jgi:hypothetical protein
MRRRRRPSPTFILWAVAAGLAIVFIAEFLSERI